MAKVVVKNIDKILLNVIPIERRFDSEGDLAIDSRVRDMYIKKGYGSAPKSREEADIRGIKNFNGLMSSFPRINVYTNGKETIVAADIAPTRYLIGQAARDIMKQDIYSEEEVQKMIPCMANVSVLTPIKKEGKYYLVSQIKGKAIGSGQILAAPVAGNVDAKYLNAADPLTEALKNECSEEIGMNLSYLNSTSFVCMIDDGAGGRNFASVARNAKLQEILNSYESDTKRKLAKNEQLELMALSILPVAGLALTPLENGINGLHKITCYKPSVDGLKEVVEDRGVRPYTEAVIDYIADPDAGPTNVKFLLEKAGF
jgi:hypothetical protein